MLAAIGETFETPLPSVDGSETAPAPSSSTSDLITGVILSTRPAFYRLAIWTRHSPSKPESEYEQDELAKRITAVGKHFKTAVLGFQEDDRLGGGYQTEVEWIKHSDSEKKDKKVSFETRFREGGIGGRVVARSRSFECRGNRFEDQNGRFRLRLTSFCRLLYSHRLSGRSLLKTGRDFTIFLSLDFFALPKTRLHL